MLAFQIFINGRKVTIAGADDLVVLSAIVSAVGKLGKKTSSLKHRKGYNIGLNVGGLTSRNKKPLEELLDWVPQKKLKIGDRIEIRVCKTTNVDIHVKKTPVNMEQKDRRHFKTVKSEYLKLRKKFEKKKVNKSPNQTR